MRDESAWLIERADSPACEPLYLGVVGQDANEPATCSGQFEWMGSHHYALRFSRRRDAVLFFGAMRSLSAVLPHGATLAGLRAGDTAPRVCEHIWASGESK